MPFLPKETERALKRVGGKLGKGVLWPVNEISREDFIIILIAIAYVVLCFTLMVFYKPPAVIT